MNKQGWNEINFKLWQFFNPFTKEPVDSYSDFSALEVGINNFEVCIVVHLEQLQPKFILSTTRLVNDLKEVLEILLVDYEWELFGGRLYFYDKSGSFGVFTI